MDDTDIATMSVLNDEALAQFIELLATVRTGQA
jgi:hypothetical protein